MLGARMPKTHQAAEERDGQHGHRDRRRDRHADFEDEIKRRRSEDDAERGADDHAPGKLRHRRDGGGDVGLVGLASRLGGGKCGGAVLR